MRWIVGGAANRCRNSGRWRFFVIGCARVEPHFSQCVGQIGGIPIATLVRDEEDLMSSTTMRRMLGGVATFFEHAATVILGFAMIIVGLGLGVTMIMLPVGVVVGLLGVLLVVGGLFARIDS
jgi:hypothetical protein